MIKEQHSSFNSITIVIKKQQLRSGNNPMNCDKGDARTCMTKGKLRVPHGEEGEGIYRVERCVIYMWPRNIRVRQIIIT